MGEALQDLSDYLLLEQCRLDNVKAFDVLFDRYSKRLYNYALNYLQDKDTAEEIMMDLMVWIWEKRQQLDPEVKLAPYLFRAIKNAVIKAMSKKSFTTVPIEQVYDDESLTTAAADTKINCHEITQVYLEKLDELSQQRRRVFKMSRHEQLSHAEIAKELNLSLFTVKNHIKASLTHFRQHLKDYADITMLLLFYISMM
ncbi:RNA polymerase sigma-70 factor [Chitinophaga nivalis]|uniref:RNA polymerase sigma-70 factor n=1 Tax=Chitinophaga nivalis TaxID=2991709 RepID=A0ABT3IGL6_9BACT|nr:RNA polymerase sigma-70 factor [Chitinophaga nivalis]MCW3467218.1 RNA polymerase sigma-70 factor [Chitinophaga nivalis]MCW3483090.1 RNA polymerase sigma-70 factor [Chitinophaga nivalis]